MDKKRKIYLLFLGLAAMGLVVDRMVLTQSATAPATASASLGMGPVAATAGDASVAVSPTSIPEIPFPRALKTAANHEEILDLFARPEARRQSKMNAALSHNDERGGTQSGVPDRLSGAVFGRSHTLDGIMVQERFRMAVVNGRPMAIGDSIDGCQLQEVSGYEARFACQDGLVVLRIDDTESHSPD